MLTLRRRLGPILVRELDADLLLLDADSDQIHQLNSTARFIWQRCDGKQSAEEIADLLASEFAVESRVALKDVIETLGKLQALNLLVDS
jgi:hypothetical protein